MSLFFSGGGIYSSVISYFAICHPKTDIFLLIGDKIYDYVTFVVMKTHALISLYFCIDVHFQLFFFTEQIFENIFT